MQCSGGSTLTVQKWQQLTTALWWSVTASAPSQHLLPVQTPPLLLHFLVSNYATQWWLFHIMVMVLLQTIANSNYAIIGDGIVLFTVL